MCLTGSSGSVDDKDVTYGIRARLLQYSRNKQKSKPCKNLPRSRLSFTNSVKGSQALPKKESFRRSGSLPKVEAEGNSEPMAITVSAPRTSEQPRAEFAKGDETAPQSHPQSVFVSTSLVGKLKAKKVKGMKGMISGMGKELKRVATTLGDTVQDHIPSNSTNKKNKEAKERQLLMGDTQKPQVRKPAEIKRAYGHTTDANHAAEVAHDKLRERGKKLSVIQDRTTALEAEAANFASLAQELQKKMENRKWYEI